MPYQPHIFADNPLDRGDQQRRDEAWLEERTLDPDTKFLLMPGLEVPLSDGTAPSLRWLNADDLNGLAVDGPPVFLGLQDGRAHFAVYVPKTDGAAEELTSDKSIVFSDARRAATILALQETGIVAQARAQLDWHNRHGFCSVCGAPTEMGRGGHVRQCPECNAQHFPRTDPVAIMLVHDGDRCLLGQSRGRLSRMRMYSALAGFIDQGESIEEAVAREVKEEAGIEVKNVRYHSSQPWPFPSSLMIGCHAEAVTTDISIDSEEMADVQWFDREELLLALEGRSERLSVPQPLAIAHHLIKTWATKTI
ncbi:MAG: NAD(+) diphosphatase [SAR202 cluster bacterium]|nr:NAD(+) diphosphatase [SAR202 cluster bacterium]MQG56465.1 NAD(+) diphosphatase [SAR202 cluster bacterium]MQG68917.1 NAD(+) diphosphatase [SAR202 cluster bacterium]